MKLIRYLSVGLLLLTGSLSQSSAQKAPAPMYRDPITDGAADPALVWNRAEKCWWMLYTQRRANTEAENVAYCYGTAIGIASSDDNGQTWVYRGTLDLQIDPGHNTFWAPTSYGRTANTTSSSPISAACAPTGAAMRGSSTSQATTSGTGPTKAPRDSPPSG